MLGASDSMSCLPRCTDSWARRRSTQCCSEPGMQCFQKNSLWASCKAVLMRPRSLVGVHCPVAPLAARGSSVGRLCSVGHTAHRTDWPGEVAARRAALETGVHEGHAVRLSPIHVARDFWGNACGHVVAMQHHVAISSPTSARLRRHPALPVRTCTATTPTCGHARRPRLSCRPFLVAHRSDASSPQRSILAPYSLESCRCCPAFFPPTYLLVG